ncbi:MAG TPA: hypothetical protein VGJ31_08685 [Dongiaceae bacterium]|jgi:ElaB/YqjD/DUF883 family membrane-anchored ribosome-binding protein
MATAKARRRVEPASFDTIVDDLGTLKRDIGRLMDQMKTGAVDGASEAAQNLLNQLNERASDIYDNLSDQGERSVKAISRQVEERPITSLLVAFGVGMIVSRLMSR